MQGSIEERCVLLGRYILRTGATVRQAAGHFGMSKSSVHKDVHERLRSVHPGLYEEVKQVLDYHHAVRHIRGGLATRKRWRLIREREINPN
ncbi:MAG: sporulation transcriptional regulator SpoIIID [Clostridia bacterium]|nr:sporulation transcriptional regulator SpoIIID [Clostridia bacterium]